MRTTSCRRTGTGAAALAVLVACAVPARAHDTTTSWTVVQLRPTELEFTMKIAAEAVWPAVQTEAPEATFAMEQLEALRPLLVRCAQRFHAASVDAQPLVALRGDVHVVEDYLEFSAVYARPKGGRLQVRAAYLARMSPEFVADISVLDEAGTVLLDEELAAGQPVLEMALPDPPASRPKARVSPGRR